nr:Chain C, peptide from Polymerase acidic protein [Influenza A virus]7N5P_C Chain C, peptide from Polymerase acidic protein [Influenza A virus]7N5Q_C Chain C, peptide from Polymerase acidic protein [Influenza A virus]7N5Q_H Chain H, peptide from Polymerase acidic protein [Influenza A virus]
SSLCNFRAYV